LTEAELHVQEVGAGLIYIVASPLPQEGSGSSYDQAHEAYSSIAEVLAGSGAEIAQERLFGLLGAKEQIRKARRDALGRTSERVPATYIEGAPVHGGSLAGVQILAIRPGGESGARVRCLDFKDKPVGRLVERFGIKFLYLSGIAKPAEGKAPGASDPRLEAEGMFAEASRILGQQGMSYTDVVRTWIYLSRILSWYDDFNQVRNRAYQRLGLQPERLPASTGIEGDNSSGTACIMDLLAVQGSQDGYPCIQAVSNPMQSEAYEYGSAFSRGMRVEEKDVVSIYASGIASVDEQGRTAHVGDERKQIERSLKNLEALLKQAGATPADICRTTVFFQAAVDPEAFHEVRKGLGYPQLPAVYVRADICRPELLFELDAAAAITK
jgi:enamine deaminase RidA (YjgF/YER057c/UK114 family)